MSVTERPTVGTLLREWRGRRHLSQLELSVEAGVSTRHLSFVETGRARPSPELVLTLAHHLDVPLRERNALLLAAGHAPRYSHVAFDDPAMDGVRASIVRLLDAHEPFPALVVDRQWNVVLANGAAQRFLASVPAELLGPPTNVYRVSLHPDGLWQQTSNRAEWATHLVRQLRRTVALTGDPTTRAMLDEVMAYPNVVALRAAIDGAAHDERPLLVPLRFTTPLGELSMFTTITTFGTPLDVTLEELTIELFYAADESTAEAMRALAAATAEPGR